MPIERTEAQKAASRANGAKSRGPTSAMGKRICAQNPMKHGLRSNLLILPTENVDDLLALNRRFNKMLAPRNPLERYQVRRMAEAEWLLCRVRDYEYAAMAAEITAAPTPAENPAVDLSPSLEAIRGLQAFDKLHAAGSSGATIDIARMRYLRQFKEAQTEFFQLREKHPGKANSSGQTRRTT